MKHVTLTALALMASTLPGMAGSIRFGEFGEIHIAALSIIMVFGLPIFIVALVLYFGYKNKQAKYTSLPPKPWQPARKSPKSFSREMPSRTTTTPSEKASRMSS